MSQFLFHLRNAPKELRWRGPLSFSLLALRELLSPLFYWHILYVFEKDVQRPALERTVRFGVKAYAGRQDLVRLIREIVPMGEISAEVIETRLASGDVAAVAYEGSDPVGYAWMSLKSGLETAFDTVWVLGAKEAIFHGSFTHPNWRGQGIQRCLDEALMDHACQSGIVKILFTISALNAPSLSATKQMRKQRIMTVVLARVRGLNWIYRKSFGAPLQSRFAISQQNERDRRSSVDGMHDPSTSLANYGPRFESRPNRDAR